MSILHLVDPTALEIIEAATRRVVEKIKQGKKLTTTDILILYLSIIREQIRAMRAEMAERNKTLREST